ncbi:ATP/GTP-binding protein OS=Streptomyces glaucescens OX=1907 GN=SGLAU_25710 PE=4 SV=1 [Streptomyces glaucescens]
MRHGYRPRWSTAVVSAAAFALTVGSPGVAVALPAAPEAAGREFASSFEADDPAPDWLNTVETAPDGGRRTSGVDGGYRSGIPGDVTDRVTGVRASGENSGAGEVKENLADGEPSTKWLVFAPTGWAEFELDEPVRLVTYALTSANDAAGRDPADWTLQGSADGKDWKTLDTRTGESFTERFQTRTYDLPAPAEFRHFRLDITKNHGAGLLQLADVQFSTGGGTGPVPEDMLSLVDRGPSGSPTAKAGAGFTGRRALRYAGRHTAEGRGYAYNKVFDVDVAVTRDTRLSYRIFPSMADGDLDYAATHAAVDLAFTDGTYLSDLGATDQHGFPLSPQGQGAAKVLYVNQWNHVAARIGSVAAGKTVDRILVAYDAPKGPARFRGWLDDVTLGRRPPSGPERTCPTTRSRPVAPTPAAASPAATTSPRPPSRTASTSGHRSPTRAR